MPNSSDNAAGWNVLLASLLETARIKQWIKNLFVFAPLVFSHGLFSVGPFSRTLAAFFIFCFFSSSVYFLNDVVDIDRDRLHPQKRRRPLPSGRLSIRAALVASCVLLCLAILLSLVVFDIRFLAIGLTYIVVNVAYSFWLKSAVLLDGMSIAAGFVLRTFAGAFAIGAMMSDWLYLCALLISLFLAFCKRRHELALLQDAAANHRAILEEYPIEFLDQLISVLTAATLVCYSLYTLDREVTTPLRLGGGLKLTIPFVIYGLLRYQFLVYRRQEGGNPADLLLRDKPLMVNFALWLAFVLCIIYS
ncbi:MAG TPA: decaprenyl-phosphate phosphoribosyltransferase [bacterium]|nr:decaprenyl-phosphate phosphoribosyltransferase [bacterium]HQL63726.1 decaprenyl-phosphate phosphoribosyltransferase [bacterium]